MAVSAAMSIAPIAWMWPPAWPVMSDCTPAPISATTVPPLVPPARTIGTATLAKPATTLTCSTAQHAPRAATPALLQLTAHHASWDTT
jgi:hypothetical protein